MSDSTAVQKENRIWWYVLAIQAATTALLVLNYIDKNIWQNVTLTLAGMWILGVAVNVVAQGANSLLTSKGTAATVTASAAQTLADAHVQSIVQSANKT